MQNPYPVLPLYVQDPKIASKTAPQPAQQFVLMQGQLQPMEFAMPRSPQPYEDDDVHTVSPFRLDGMGIALIVFLIFFTIWDLFLTLGNLTTFYYMLKHLTIYVALVVAYFGLSLLLKLFTMGYALIILTCPPVKGSAGTVFTVMFVGLGLSAAGLVGFFFWSWANLSIGVNIGLIIDMVLYACTVIFTYIVYSALKLSHDYAFVLPYRLP